MQDVAITKKYIGVSEIEKLPLTDRQRLVDVFVWLLEEDKKQNPAHYQLNKKHYD